MIKSREVPRQYSSSSTTPDGQVTNRTMSYCSESQQIDTFSHAPGHLRLGDAAGDVGGPFFSIKLKWGSPSAHYALQGDLAPSDLGWRSEGILVPDIVASEMRLGAYGPGLGLDSLSPGVESENSMTIAGTTAISRVAPTNPVWDGASAIAEMYGAGVIPKAPLANSRGHLPTSGKDIRDLNPGSEYLNLAFGYAPLASDIATLRDTAQRSEKILEQLERGSGRVTRRSYEFPEQELPARGPFSGQCAGVFLGGTIPTAYEQPGYGTWQLNYTRSRNRKFSGAFTYHLPPKGTWRRKIVELDRLYGVVPGVDTAWNAVPFSWLADYYGNMGDVLQNITAFAQDGLVMKYGYITSVTTDVGVFSWEIPIRRQGDRNAISTASGTCELSVRTIKRVPANPFGFGPSGVPITGRQKAIIAALGLSLV